MKLTLIFLVCLIIIIVVAIIFITSGSFEPTSEQIINPDLLLNAYAIPSPWGWVTRTVDNIQIAADSVHFNEDDTVSATFGSESFIFRIVNSRLSSGNGIGGMLTSSQLSEFSLVGAANLNQSCTPYVFLSSQPNIPSSSKFSLVSNCETLTEGNGVPGDCYTVPDLENCIDDDELYSQKKIHACRGIVVFPGIETSGICRGQNGQSYNNNDVEILYEKCVPPGITPDSNTGGTVTRCNGSLSFLTLGENNPTCFREPPYLINSEEELTNLQPFTLGICSLTDIYMEFPRQLFRIKPGVYNGNSIVFNTSGSFLRILNRGTGLCMSPQFTTVEGQPIPSKPIAGPIQLSSCSINLNGYFWYLLPTINQPEPYEVVNGRNVIYGIRQQLIYVIDPLVIPNSYVELWNWIYANRFTILSVQLINGILQLGPLIIVDRNDTTPGSQDASMAAVFNYVDYTFAHYL